VNRDAIEALFYGPPDQQRRFTVDFPVLPDVWMAYGEKPGERVPLLLSPYVESSAPAVALALRARLSADEARSSRWAAEHPAILPRRVLFNESVVLATLSFSELVRCALPLSNWWDRVLGKSTDWARSSILDLCTRLSAYRPPGPGPLPGADPQLLLKLIRITTGIEADRRHLPVVVPGTTPDLTEAESTLFADLVEGLPSIAPDAAGCVWSISLNREATTSVWRSRLTIKADAASRLFEANTAGIRWAVLDTGIDARHPAFQRRAASPAAAAADAAPPAAAPAVADPANSRVLKTYDFLRLKDLLDPDAPLPADSPGQPDVLRPLREELRLSLQRGRAVDWSLIEPLLRIPHSPASDYRPPAFDAHGTHVAGILAANWTDAPKQTSLQSPLIGVCPDLELYDLRVLPDNPRDKADEFTVIAALQFVRYLNAHKDLLVVHGVNLSLSVPHDVANYACGRTPVCEECERVVASGVVVVAAAGNRGFDKRQGAPAMFGDYRYISITDPGNADGVITVGSTHRMQPHNYGVSYFSSRGPTGDGRTKPDLVAPGERIDSCSLNGYFETMDGTSMAAPHVSGAAALLLARHRELIGQPRRVKDVLCRAATDLGREPRFQGAGLVDVLRALQSV
jgi:hypothetical protein